MHPIVEVRHPLVTPIHSQGVLGEIVGADAEKIAFCGKDIGRNSGRGNFDHDAYRHIGIVVPAILVKEHPDFLE